MTYIDFSALIDVPESMVVEFFDIFDIEDNINFPNHRTFELANFNILNFLKFWESKDSAGPTKCLRDISPIQFQTKTEDKIAK
jgi:hypothetical protein